MQRPADPFPQLSDAVGETSKHQLRQLILLPGKATATTLRGRDATPLAAFGAAGKAASYHFLAGRFGTFLPSDGWSPVLCGTWGVPLTFLR